jgi:hypothetical protein
VARVYLGEIDQPVRVRALSNDPDADAFRFLFTLNVGAAAVGRHGIACDVS